MKEVKEECYDYFPEAIIKEEKMRTMRSELSSDPVSHTTHLETR
jgi:hypothetical protein